MKAALKKIAPFISIVFFGLAIWFLDRELRQYNIDEIFAQLSAIPNIYILISMILAALSYLVLTAYDGLGVRYIGESLPPGKVIRAGYIGYAFSHNIGLALITGGSIRYRIYSAWGFTGIQVTQIVAFSALTLWIGFCSVAGMALLFATPNLPQGVALPFVSLRVLGILLLLMVVGYIWASGKIKKQLSVKGWTFSFPGLDIAVKQVLVASVDWIMAASVLYVLLPDSEINFFSFTGVFLLAQIIGLFSQVPGGLGVFESVMLLYLSNFMSGSAVLGTLVVYRIIYYILPLLGAVIVLGYQEYQANRHAVKQFGQKAVSWFPRIVPQVLSITVFIGGAVLLFSGSMPSDVPRMQWLQHFLPLPVIEMSHFLASLVGAALLVLARSLQRRIDAAYHLTVVLLIVGILFTLLKGGGYEEAIFLTVMLVALILSRKEFYRKASLLTSRFSSGWAAMIFIVIVSSIWLGFFSFSNVEYQNSLWWQFTLLGDAPRYLRATVGVLGFAVIIGLIKLLLPRRREAKEPREHEMQIAKRILETSYTAKSNLFLLKDKELLFSENQKAFIMYAVEGKSWVAMGDPVGDDEEAEELIWKFHEKCEAAGGWTVFHKVQEINVNIYIDLGLTLLKLGEEAKVDLSDFRTDTDKYAKTMPNYHHFKEEGYSLEIVKGADRLDAYMDVLQKISESWVINNKSNERGFSQGTFNAAYLKHFPIAILTYQNKVVGFSNLWTTTHKEELSFDLLRHYPEVPETIRDYMLVEIMLWGKRQGYQWFNLGMAPLAGVSKNDRPKDWQQLTQLLYSYGGRYYDFEEARHFREGFHPRWEPRYLASPGGLALPGVFSSLTLLVNDGIKGVFK